MSSSENKYYKQSILASILNYRLRLFSGDDETIMVDTESVNKIWIYRRQYHNGFCGFAYFDSVDEFERFLREVYKHGNSTKVDKLPENTMTKQ